MLTLLRKRRIRKQTIEGLAFIDSLLLADAARQARNTMPRMESRHIPTEWWVPAQDRAESRTA